MQLSTIYQKVGQFATEAINRADVSVVYAYQNAPRPKKPFVTVHISVLRHEDMPSYFPVQLDGTRNIIFNKRFTATFQSFSDKLHEAEELLITLENQLATSLTDRIFLGEIAFQKTLMGVAALPVASDATNESRAIYDAEFSVSQEVTDDIGFVNIIQVNRGEI